MKLIYNIEELQDLDDIYYISSLLYDFVEITCLNDSSKKYLVNRLELLDYAVKNVVVSTGHDFDTNDFSTFDAARTLKYLRGVVYCNDSDSVELITLNTFNFTERNLKRCIGEFAPNSVAYYLRAYNNGHERDLETFFSHPMGIVYKIDNSELYIYCGNNYYAYGNQANIRAGKFKIEPLNMDAMVNFDDSISLCNYVDCIASFDNISCYRVKCSNFDKLFINYNSSYSYSKDGKRWGNYLVYDIIDNTYNISQLVRNKFEQFNKEKFNLSSENMNYDKRVDSIRDEYSSGEMLAGLMANFAEGLCNVQKKAIEEARVNDEPKVIRHYKDSIKRYDTASVATDLFTSSASMPVLFDTYISILKNKSSEYIVGLQGSAGVGKNVVIEQAIIDIVKDYGQAYIGVYNCDQSATQMNLTEYINPLTDSVSIGILYEAIIKANELYKVGDDTPVILLLNELTRMRGDNLAQALSFFSASDTVISINGVNYKRTPNLRIFFNGNTDKGSDVSNLINTDTAWGRRMQSYDLTGVLYPDPFVEGKVCYDVLDKVRQYIADGTIKDISSERFEDAVKIAQTALDVWDGDRFPAEAKISLGQLKHDTDRDKDKEIFANVK